MFATLAPCDPGPDAIEALFGLLLARAQDPSLSEENPCIPAGYTYLGQFVDHDITFEPMSRLDRSNDPAALVDFRTPRLDLDSMYGTGPADQPFLYDWSGPEPGVKLLVGANPAADCEPLDLPRNEQQRALIGDARNDEHLIIAQLHLLFLHVHNNVVDMLRAQQPGLTGTDLFELARQTVRWHYQWVVTHDLVPRLVGDEMAAGVLAEHPDGGPATIELRHFHWRQTPFMPVEFSAAGFRCGHSMVRPDYRLNAAQPHSLPILPDPEREGHLAGTRRLPAGLAIEWDQFFETAGRSPQLSMRLDASLSMALFRLPSGAALARTNLRRGVALGLPSGGAVAREMRVDPLTADELLGPCMPGADALPAGIRDALLRDTPLWFYILCEAMTDRYGAGGEHLGPVGGRIVAEVFVGLLAGDPTSYLRQRPAWTPSLGQAQRTGEFTMSDLVELAQAAT